MNMRKTHDSADREWITPLEASALLPSVSRRTVQSWAKKGKLPNSLKLPSGQWRIAVRDIEEILEAGRAGA
ncbi:MULTISPECIES: helix-turn-helix domain-containing protein [Corynebacterium]|uniref:helix-turn-helix domain-containing protein n=1 Tax=Corynebacterium TaxID=1716 RepID=UPI00124CE138